MLGRNKMRFNKTRLRDTHRLINELFHRQIGSGISVAIACVICVTGCSRLGSNGPLSQRKIPFPPQPLRQVSSQTVAAEKAKAMESVNAARDLRAVDSHDIASAVRTETSPARDAVQNLKARPPKLSELPSTTLYAEPVIDKAKQVAFQGKANDFNPSAKPPAAIFSQPLAKAVDDQFVDPTPSLPTVNPERFVVSDPQPNDSQKGLLNPIRPNNGLSKEPQPILLVNDQSTKATAATISQASEIASPDQLKQQVVKNFVPQPLRPVVPVIIEKTPAEANIGPKVDANLKGEAYSKSFQRQAVKPLSLDEQFFTPKRSPNKIVTKPVIKKELPKVQPIKVEDFKTNFSPADSFANTAPPKSESKPDSTNGIEIDPTLGAQRESRLNFSPPRKIAKTQPEPAPVVFQKKKAPFLMLPRVRKALPEVSDTRIAKIAEPAFTPTLEKQEILPVKKCATCDLPDCGGCNIPAENQFSAAAPNIHRRRSLAPMAVEHSADQVEIAKKNFGQVAFTPVGLPLPETVVKDAENIVAAFNQQVPQELENAETQSDVPPVGVEAVLKLNEVTWRSRLQQTILLVKDQLDSDIDSQTRTSLEINLRLLDVLSRQMGDIANEERSFTQSENHFWQHQLEAITSMLQTSELADVKANDLLKHHTAHDTLVHLRHAIAELESLANLKIASGAFCTEVSGYGQFKTFISDVFNAGQKVLVYCEVENYNSVQQSSDSGSTFHTRLRGSYAIYDSAGHAVQQAEFPVVEDIARRRRRDFYMHLPITIGDLSNGDYELHLLVEDLGGNKTASLSPPLLFTISSSDPVDLQARTQNDGHLVR